MFKLYKKIISIVILLLATTLNAAAQIDSCQPKNIELWVEASFATDGNTIIIQNRKFRLISVNAPQKRKERKFNTPGQPLAAEAQHNLNRLLANHNLQIGVEYDTTKMDAFNRGLVHLYVKKDDKIYNLNQLMLESGYAFVRSEHSNYLHKDCYFRAEARAREQGLGIWGLLKNHPQLHYPLVESSAVTMDDRGFRIFRGEIVKAEKGRNHYILNMDTTGIRIHEKYLYKFDLKQLDQLKGQVVEVRGRAFPLNNSMFVKINSPHAIDLLRKKNAKITK